MIECVSLSTMKARCGLLLPAHKPILNSVSVWVSWMSICVVACCRCGEWVHWTPAAADLPLPLLLAKPNERGPRHWSSLSKSERKTARGRKRETWNIADDVLPPTNPAIRTPLRLFVSKFQLEEYQSQNPGGCEPRHIQPTGRGRAKEHCPQYRENALYKKKSPRTRRRSRANFDVWTWWSSWVWDLIRRIHKNQRKENLFKISQDLNFSIPKFRIMEKTCKIFPQNLENLRSYIAKCPEYKYFKHFNRFLWQIDGKIVDVSAGCTDLGKNYESWIICWAKRANRASRKISQ